jgi:hypothetical protein
MSDLRRRAGALDDSGNIFNVDEKLLEWRKLAYEAIERVEAPTNVRVELTKPHEGVRIEGNTFDLIPTEPVDIRKFTGRKG